MLADSLSSPAWVGTNNDYGDALTDMHWGSTGVNPSYDYFELYFWRPDRGVGKFQIKMKRRNRRKYVTLD